MANRVFPPISPIPPSILGNPHSDHSWGGPRIGKIVLRLCGERKERERNDGSATLKWHVT